MEKSACVTYRTEEWGNPKEGPEKEKEIVIWPTSLREGEDDI